MEKKPESIKETQNPSSKLDKKSDIQETTTQTLKKAQEDLAVANDKYLRLYSEFENFRRRSAKEKLLLVETAGEELLGKLLPILDDFERAMEAMNTPESSSQATQAGVQLIYDKLLRLLQQAGVKPIVTEKGTSFDTELHEAITQMPVEDTKMKGKVIDVVEKGYSLKEKVLRFAKVVTGA